MYRKTKQGFTLVEIMMVVIILGVLAAVVIPQVSSAADAAKTAATKMQLTTVRGQLQRYYMEHSEWPSLAQLQSSWDVMVSPTDIDGTINAASGVFGPYLQGIPFNIYTDSAEVVPSGGTAEHGWIYDDATGSILAIGFNETTGIFTTPGG